MFIVIGYIAYREDKIVVTWQGIAQASTAVSLLLVSIAWIVFCERQMKSLPKEEDFKEGWEQDQ